MCYEIHSIKQLLAAHRLVRLDMME